jgi:hypothetical protein
VSNEELEQKIESLEADIAVFKTLINPPRGFSSWEQFDKVTKDAYENQ